MKYRTLCPAKINTFLSVGQIDRQGYHPIRTIFQAIALADELIVETGTCTTDQINCTGFNLPVENTLTKALRLAREPALIPPLSITLHKYIPAESGLGGGSSDAAGLLRILQKICPQGFLTDSMGEIALSVGADVPFFLNGGRAKAEGYGEKITPLPDEPPQTLLIVRPKAGISTKHAYETLDGQRYEWADFPVNLAHTMNDFERVASEDSLQAIRRMKALGSDRAGLSGSGSAVFGFFPTLALACKARAILESENLMQVWLTNTLTREESLWTS